jgi:hypothetical protein
VVLDCQLTGGDRGHYCGLKPSQKPCWNCWRKHTLRHPHCYIQPLDYVRNKKLEEAKKRREAEGREAEQGDELDAEAVAEGERKQKPVRYIFFDCETQQDRRVELGGELVQRHDVNLICSEVLCEFCFLEGISTTDGAERMAKDCVCGISAKSKNRFHFPHLNSRRLQFNNFDDPKVGQCFFHIHSLYRL